MSTTTNNLPLKNLTVLEFTHAVMGPTTGLLCADMGATVIHIEPTTGDETRNLKGFGTGYFPFYSRNKKSLAINIKTTQGQQIIYKLANTADIIIENFGPGTMDRLGYGYEKIKTLNPKIIYCSLKGFATGPYQNRHAMDEVVQMMGGLAYMTGRPGDPLRAGTSVIDITGGMFGYIGILQALYQRQINGEGSFVQASLFETTAFLMGQHMAYSAITQVPVPPMPARVSAWSIYKIFNTADAQQVFVGIISEKHWVKFCEAFNMQNWLADIRLQTNNQRIAERAWFLPAVENLLLQFTKTDIENRCQNAGIPFAPIATPEDLFNDPQLNQGGSLLPTTLPNGTQTKLPKFPLEFNNVQQSVRQHPPQIGEHTTEILQNLGLNTSEIDLLKSQNIIV